MMGLLLSVIALPQRMHAESGEVVILLHGLARTKGSMEKMEKHLRAEGFRVHNRGYASRTKTIEKLAMETLPKAIAHCRDRGATKIHFVTHSMGGILVRYYLKHHNLQELGRVVMLSPPNGGSEVVDKLGQTWMFKWLNGPAGQQLGTGENSVPNQLGPVEFDLGIITGDRSINLILSCLIPGPDDGKVAIDHAKIRGMKDFRVIHAAHPFIMKNKKAMSLVVTFLKTGQFAKEGP